MDSLPPPFADLPPGTDSVSVAEFMQAALYHPEHGYYTRHVRTVGRRGDFSTGPAISDLWGRALARWVAARRPAGRPLHLIEIGGGAGDLAFHLLQRLGWWRRWGLGLRYHLVEISGSLRERQRERLRGFPVTWHGRIEDALAAARGRALIFSNELVDAFPCEQFVRRGHGWRQVRLCPEAGGGWREIEREALLPASSALALDVAEGQRVEVHASYRAWLAAWRPLWQEGALLTVDYGEQVETLYHRRPRGTLRGYAHHQLVTPPALYAHPGHRDLTADVNFTDLETWGAELGLAARSRQSQAAFLRHWIPGCAEAPDPATAYLLAEEGMGGAFQVLEQQPMGSF